MRVIVQVVIITESIDVGPSLELPVQLVVDPEPANLDNRRLVDALPQPADCRVFQDQQVPRQVIGCQIRMIGIDPQNL